MIAINKLWLELTTKNKNQHIFSTAEKFEDHPTHKEGKNGIITADYDPPHYYFKAESFKYTLKKESLVKMFH